MRQTQVGHIDTEVSDVGALERIQVDGIEIASRLRQDIQSVVITVTGEGPERLVRIELKMLPNNRPGVGIERYERALRPGNAQENVFRRNGVRRAEQ